MEYINLKVLTTHDQLALLAYEIKECHDGAGISPYETTMPVQRVVRPTVGDMSDMI
jgi:hypothetical protein